MSQSRFIVYSLFVPTNVLNKSGGNFKENLIIDLNTEVFYIFDMDRGVTLNYHFVSYESAENKCNEQNKSHAGDVQFKRGKYHKHYSFVNSLDEGILLLCNDEDIERLKKRINDKEKLKENLEVINQSFKSLVSEEPNNAYPTLGLKKN